MFEQTFKNIDDILHKDAGCTSELDYTEESSWLLFLKYLDALEADKAPEAALEGKTYHPILIEPYRWSVWAAPKTPNGQINHNAALTRKTVPSVPTQQLAQHIRQDAAIAEVVDLDRRVDAQYQGEFLSAAIGTGDVQACLALRGELGVGFDIDQFVAGQAQAVP